MTEFIIDNSIRTLVSLLCVGAASAVVCRVRLMESKNHKFVWFLMLVGMGGFALGTAIDVMRGEALSWHTLLGLTGITAYLYISMDTWRTSAPEAARK